LDGNGGKCEQKMIFSICQDWALDKAQFLMDGKIIGKKWSVPKWEGKEESFVLITFFSVILVGPYKIRTIE
jgi:hypothetical protein